MGGMFVRSAAGGDDEQGNQDPIPFHKFLSVGVKQHDLRQRHHAIKWGLFLQSRCEVGCVSARLCNNQTRESEPKHIAMKRILGLILLILAILGSVNYVKRLSSGNQPRPTGNAAYDSGQQVGTVLVPIVLAVMGLFGLRWLISGDGDYQPAPAPARRSTAGNPSLSGRHDTFASNPALLKLRAVSWLAAKPIIPIASASLALIGFVLLFIKLPVGIVLIVTSGIVLFRQVSEAKQKYYRGDMCPGLVLSAQKNLVAVFTDLKAASLLPQPAIKILKQPLRLMTGEPAYDGMRVAAVALYQGDSRRPAWQNFSPEVIQCVVHDPEQIAHALGSISESEWQRLDAHLTQVPIDRPGLYRLSGVSFAPPSGISSGSEIENDWPQPTPWFKTTPAIIFFCVFGGIATFIVLLSFAGTLLSSRNRYHGPVRPPTPGVPPAASTPRRAPGPPELKVTGPYAIGTSVQANWAGEWLPGKITSINYGGRSVMVQLQDHRYPVPMLLFTNQIRLK